MLRQIKWCTENLLHKCRLCCYPFLLLTERMPGSMKGTTNTNQSSFREHRPIAPQRDRISMSLAEIAVSPHPSPKNPWEIQVTGNFTKIKFSTSMYASLLQKDCALCEKVVPEQTVGEKPCLSKKSEISGLEYLSSLLVLCDLSSDTW